MSAAEVWIVDLAQSEARLTRCAASLSQQERDRADRFLRPADRARYTASHAALRLILARAVGLDPREIAFTVGAAGKPELDGPARGLRTFNLSHSGACALIGLAHGAAIGVDVEAIRPLPDALRIARSHFSRDETEALAASPREAVEAAFFGLWTRKEAVVKALGAGLFLPLDRFSVTVPPTVPRVLRIDDPGGWTLADIEAGPGIAAALAVRSLDATVTVHRLPPDWPDTMA